MGDLWEDPSTILAAVFCILCILLISEDGSSLRRVLHESSLDVTFSVNFVKIRSDSPNLS